MKWSDDWLDDLNRKVDNGFARVDGELKELRREMKTRFDSIDARFEALNQRLFMAAIMVIAALIGVNVF